jgi:hypothetical protein
MMLKKGISILFIMLTAFVRFGSAQQKSSNGIWQFHSVNNLGLLEGQAGSSFQLQTINGVQNRSWFGGIGVGLDYYRYRTIPLFFDIRREFGKNPNKIFLYADLGINFPWLTDNEKSYYLVDDKFSNEIYSDLGLGYKVKTGKNNNFLISLGFSFKKLTETYRSQVYYDPGHPADPQFDKINYNLNRLSIKMGWEL